MNYGSGLFLSAETLKSLPLPFRLKLLAAVFETPSMPTNVDTANNEGDEQDEHYAELSPGQAKNFLNGCSDKVRLAIETMVKGQTNRFKLAEVAEALNAAPSELRGVWGGITRRTKTITGDSDAYLLAWLDDAEHDDEGNYTNHTGEMTQMTYRSFRKHFRL